jgi:hypothetical protein
MKMSHIWVSIVVATALSGCVSNGKGAAGGGAGGGGGGASSTFETEFGKVEATAPTQNMPTALDANYKGQMKLGVNTGTSTILPSGVDANMAEIIGDVDLNVAWTDGMTTNPFTGTAGNFTATEAGTSNTVAIAGTLNVDPSLPGTVTRVHTPAQTLMGHAIPALDTGAFEMTMKGQLGAEGEKGDVTLLLGGNFIGDNAASMMGAVSGGVKDVNSTGPAIFDAGLGGVFYANK